MAFLQVIQGGYPGQIVELAGDRMVLGRHPNCEIVLDNLAVSRHHAQILQSHGNFYLEDLRSRNHTYLNDEAVKGRKELCDQDQIKICDVVFGFHTKLPPEGDSSWLAESTEHTVIGAPPPAASREVNIARITPLPPTTAEDSDAGKSSIISTINAKDSSGLRLGVKPEVKLRAILSIAQALAQTLRIDEVLEKTLDELFKIFPQADEGFVLLQNARTKKLVVSATKVRGRKPDDSVRVSMTVVDQAMRGGQAILSHDASQDPQFESSDSLSSLQIRSMMCVPLVDPDGKSLGVIQLAAKDLRQQFSNDDLDVLVSVASQVTLAVENARMHQEAIRQRELEQQLKRKADEMDLAVQVQLEFLPDSPPSIPGYEFFDFYEAALEVGGDYFDYIEIAPGRFAVTLGDVAGKGVPAALLMAKLSSAARFHLLSKPTIEEALKALNAEMASGGLGHRFITLAVLVLDANAHRVTVANAGHLPPIMRKRDGSVIELANNVAETPLGVEPDQTFRTDEYPVEVGEVIVLHTDGITEAMSPQEEVYGRKRLKEFIANGPRTVAELGEGILQDVEEFSDAPTQRDDVCLVCLQRTGEEQPPPSRSRRSKAQRRRPARK